MEHTQYELHSFNDLMNLEDDQIDRLCAELPGMVKQAKAVMGLMNACGEAVGIESPVAELMNPLIWIDDSENNLTMSLTDGEKEHLRYESKKGA